MSSIYKCATCAKTFQSQRALNAHQISHKDGPRYSVERKQKNRINPYTYECEQCGKEAKWSNKKVNKYCSPECSQKSRWLFSTIEEREKYRKAKKNFYHQKYMRQKKKQTPPDADLQLIEQIYLDCPEGHHVDHIIPLSRGGLHHQDNLQYLPATENIAKGNMMPDEWEEYKKKNGAG